MPRAVIFVNNCIEQEGKIKKYNLRGLPFLLAGLVLLSGTAYLLKISGFQAFGTPGGGVNSQSNRVIYVNCTRPEDSGDGSSWTTAKKTVSAAVSLVTTDNIDIWIAGNCIYESSGLRIDSRANFGIYGGFRGDEVMLADRPQAGSGFDTIIDAKQYGQILKLYNVSGPVLDGLTFQNGKSASFNGGAINVFITSGGQPLTMNNVVIKDSSTTSATSTGGGLFLNGSTTLVSVLKNITITGCSSAKQGGGADISGPFEITNAIIDSNSAPIGGGLTISGTGGNGIISRSKFTNNVANASSGTGGGAIYSTTKFTSNRNFYFNNRAPNGSAIYVYNTALAGDFINSIFSSNKAINGRAVIFVMGGASGASAPIVSANTFTRNSATAGDVIMRCENYACGANSLIADNDFNDNTGPVGSFLIGRDATSHFGILIWKRNNAWPTSAVIADPNDQAVEGPDVSHIDHFDPKLLNTTFLDNPLSYTVTPDSLDIADLDVAGSSTDYSGATRNIKSHSTYDCSGGASGGACSTAGAFEYQGVSQTVSLTGYTGSLSGVLLHFTAFDPSEIVKLADANIPMSSTGFFILPAQDQSPSAGNAFASGTTYKICLSAPTANPPYGETCLTKAMVASNSPGVNFVLNPASTSAYLRYFGWMGINGDSKIQEVRPAHLRTYSDNTKSQLLADTDFTLQGQTIVGKGNVYVLPDKSDGLPHATGVKYYICLSTSSYMQTCSYMTMVGPNETGVDLGLNGGDVGGTGNHGWIPDNRVNLIDLGIVLNEFGNAPPLAPYADVDGNGSDGLGDLGTVLTNFNFVGD